MFRSTLSIKLITKAEDLPATAVKISKYAQNLIKRQERILDDIRKGAVDVDASNEYTDVQQELSVCSEACSNVVAVINAYQKLTTVPVPSKELHTDFKEVKTRCNVIIN